MTDQTFDEIPEEDEFVTFYDEDGKEYQFELLDAIEIDDGRRYVALCPVCDDEDDEHADEVLIFEVVTDEDGETLEQIEDDEQFAEIAGIFEDRLSEMYDFAPDDEY